MPTHSLLAGDARVERLATGMKFLEGPVFMPEGMLLFSDQMQDKVLRWTAADGVTVFREDGNGCNGNTLDLERRRITCEGIKRRMARTEADGSMTILCDRFEGKKFNSPNDVVVKSDGTIWFTDPPYWVPKNEKRELEKQCVFRFDPKTKTVSLVIDDFDMPNGLCFSPNEKKLYIADSGKPHHIRVFDVIDGTKLANDKVFTVITPGVPDGMRVDAAGNLWSSAGDGVHVFSPAGEALFKIAVPETPANLCWGGGDGKTLYITARTSLYSIQTTTTDAARRIK